MLDVRHHPLLALSLGCCLAALAGCQRSGEPAPAMQGDPAAAGTPAPVEDVPPPAGVLRAYVWQCDGGLTLRTKNLYREDAVTVEMHEGPRKLPLVVSASGARYSDGSLTFWTKGDTATFQRGEDAPVHCRELRAESLLADARERGVLYRGTGNEPGWFLEIGADGGIAFVTSYGQERHEFGGATRRDGAANGVVYVAGQGTERIEVTVRTEPCADDMSGAEFDYRMVVQYGGEELRGCAAVPR